MPRPILTPEAKAALVNELRQAAQEYRRVCPYSLGAKYGISPNSVRTYGSKHGIPVRAHPSREDHLRQFAAPTRTMRDLVALSGMHYITVKAVIRYADLAGRPIPYLSRRGKPVDVLDRLPPHVAAWVISQVPEGGTVHELITAIIVDAYNEEH